MSNLNLFSKATQKEQQEKNVIKLSKTWVIIISVNLFIFLIALAVSFVNLYYNLQVSDKGKKIIDLMASQKQYKPVISSLEDFVAKKAAVAQLNDSKIYLEGIIAEIDKQTNLTTYNYNVETTNSSYSIKGTIKNLDDIYTITKQMRSSKLFTNIHLNNIQSQENKDYFYSISFILNTDEAKQLK